MEGEFDFDFDGGTNPMLNGELLFLVPAAQPEPAQITHMWVSGRVSVKVIEIGLTHGDYNGTPFSTGVVELPDGTFQLVAVEKPGSPAKWNVVKAAKDK